MANSDFIRKLHFIIFRIKSNKKTSCKIIRYHNQMKRHLKKTFSLIYKIILVLILLDLFIENTYFTILLDSYQITVITDILCVTVFLFYHEPKQNIPVFYFIGALLNNSSAAKIQKECFYTYTTRTYCFVLQQGWFCFLLEQNANSKYIFFTYSLIKKNYSIINKFVCFEPTLFMYGAFSDGL